MITPPPPSHYGSSIGRCPAKHSGASFPGLTGCRQSSLLGPWWRHGCRSSFVPRESPPRCCGRSLPGTSAERLWHLWGLPGKLWVREASMTPKIPARRIHGEVHRTGNWREIGWPNTSWKNCHAATFSAPVAECLFDQQGRSLAKSMGRLARNHLTCSNPATCPVARRTPLALIRGRAIGV